MSKFSLQRGMPSCLVTKELLISIETYLNGEMREKFGEILGDKIDYRISIMEKIGTETLAGINEYTPTVFSDGIQQIQVRWNNGYLSTFQLDLRMDFEGKFMSDSTLKIECTALTARETAIGIGDAITRLLESHRTYNWIFNPFGFPTISFVAFCLVFVLLYLGFAVILIDRKTGMYFLAAGVFFSWLLFSGIYIRPRITFDTRRQRMLDKLWLYFSLGIFGFVFFGTLLPLIRAAILGF